MSKEFSEINRKLDILVKLTAARLIQDRDNYREQVKILHKAGLAPKDIAALTGKTTNNVNVTIHLIRKQKRR